MSKKGVRTETQPIEWKEAMWLLDKLKDAGIDNTRLMLACGFYFGLRISDILNIRWNDILGDGFTIEEQKNNKVRRIKLNEEFKQIRDEIISNLQSMPDGNDLIFIHQRIDAIKTRPISITAANKRIKKVFEEYRIKVKNPSSHTLRKTFGKRVYEHFNKSEDALIKLSQVFNHSSVAITRRYIGITQEMIDDIYTSI